MYIKLKEKLQQKNLYELAKIISNEFIGKFEFFSCDLIHKKGTKNINMEEFYYIESNKCDMCPSIRIYTKDNGTTILSFYVNGDYTRGLEEVHEKTLNRIIEYFIKNNNLLLEY